MAELMFPDIGGSFLRGQLIGTQQRQEREGEQRRNRLADLAGQAWNAPSEQRSALIGQAVGVDPEAGMALAQGLSSEDDRRNQSMVHMAKLLTSAPEQYRPGLYQQMMPSLQRMGMSQLPPQYDDTVAQAAQSIVSAYAGVDGSTPAGLREFQGMTQGLEPDEVMRARRIALGLDPRQSSAAIGYQKITGPDGREYLVATDPRSIGATTIGGGPSFGSFAGQGPAGEQGNPVPNGDAHVEQTLSLANEMAAAGIPDEQVTAFINGRLNPQGAQAPQAATMQPQGGQLPPRLDPVNGGQVNPFASRTPEEQAALTEAARMRTQLDYLPQQQAIETQGAIDRERGVGQAKIDVERAEQAPKRVAGYRQALTAAGNVQESIDNALGMLGPLSTGFIGARSRGIEGSPAYNLAAEIETVKANLGFDRLQQMRDNSPTGGALGQVAVQELIALQSTVANLDPNQSEEQIRANLGRVKSHYDNWVSAVRQALSEEGEGRPAAPAGEIDELLELYR